MPNIIGHIYLVGQPTAKLWGLDLLEWQERAFKKFDVSLSQKDQEATHFLDAHFILSNNLLKAFAKSENTALIVDGHIVGCLLYTSPSPRDQRGSRMPSSA